MLPEVRERQLQVIARRCGLKIVLDRYSTVATGQRSYFLRPIWDARRAVRLLPGGEHELVTITVGRRQAASLLTLDGVEHVLKSWNEPEPFAPARLPWQAGVVAERFPRH
jgi:hypothetical protein